MVRSPSAHALRRSLLLLTVVACGRGGDDASTAAAAPSSGGDVWETDHAEQRATAPATMLAFVNGLHVVVMDGDDAYAGMTRLQASATSGGARSIALANGLRAELAPVGDVMELRFSSGETVPLRRQPERANR